MKLSGWWEKNSINPSEKYEFVTGKDYISLSFNGKLKKMFQTTNQLQLWHPAPGPRRTDRGFLVTLGERSESRRLFNGIIQEVMYWPKGDLTSFTKSSSYEDINQICETRPGAQEDFPSNLRFNQQKWSEMGVQFSKLGDIYPPMWVKKSYAVWCV